MPSFPGGILSRRSKILGFFCVWGEGGREGILGSIKMLSDSFKVIPAGSTPQFPASFSDLPQHISRRPYQLSRILQDALGFLGTVSEVPIELIPENPRFIVGLH